MSSAQYSSDGKRVAGKAPEKSNFAQTCSLLSQYLKEKRGSFRDLNLDITGKQDAAIGKLETSRIATTVDLLPNVGNSGQSSTHHVKSVNISPRHAEVGSGSCIIEKDHASNKTALSKSATAEAKAPQMTLFYGGQVLVFDDFPADRAREVLQLAGKPTSTANLGFPPTSNADQMDSDDSLASGSNIKQPILAAAAPSPPAKDSLRPKSEASSSGDLPIARRASLHRFLEKRKDRAIVRAPYHVLNRPSPGSSGQDEQQLELKL